MNRSPLAAFRLVLCLYAFTPLCLGAEPAVYFSPAGGCTESVVGAIHRAGKEIRVQAYSFTSAPIAAALVDAHRRGVDVRVILDRRQAAGVGCRGQELAAAGILVATDGKHPIAHNKLILIDGRWVITGSFNFSAQAERNAENLLVLDDAGLALRYLEQWRLHAAHSQPLATPPPGEVPVTLRQ